jgi:hypothetical protein
MTGIRWGDGKLERRKGLKVGEKPSLNKISQSPNPAKFLYSLESELSVADLLLEQTRQTSMLAPISATSCTASQKLIGWLRAKHRCLVSLDLQDDH